MPVPVKRITRKELGKPDDPSDLKRYLRENRNAILSGAIELNAIMERAARNVEMMRQRVLPSRMPLVQKHFASYGACQACELGKHVFVNNRVIFRGFVPAKVMFIVDAPGFGEDTNGLPCLGQEGQVLNRAIYEGFDHAFGRTNWERFTYNVTNMVCCVPVDMDPLAKSAICSPLAKHIKACSPRLKEWIELVRPRLIVTCGNKAERHVGRNFNVTPLNFASIRDPAFILEQKDQDLELRRAIITVSTALTKYFDPAEFA